MSEFLSFAKRTSVSTMPVQPGKFIPLSVLDRAMQHNIIRVVFYYRKFDKMVKLHESIAETLNAFTNITGRLVMRSGEEKWVVKCNDAGLRVIEARVKGSVDEWLRNVDREKELKLAHWEPMPSDPYFWSPFYLQITEFEGGGAAIGLSCTHLLADPIAATLFIRAWADISAFAGKMLSPPHIHPLPLRTLLLLNKNPHNHHQTHPHARCLIDHYKLRTAQNQSPSHISPAKQPTTITLLFPDEAVRSCMLMAQTVPGGGAFEALAGLFWTRITKVKKVGLMDLVVGFDARKVLGLDKGFFGNCMVYNKVPWDKGSMESEDGLLSEAALAITNVMKETDRESIIDLIEWLEQNNGPAAASNLLFDGRDSLLVCANLEELDSYSACFGDHFEPPVHVSCYIEPDVGPVSHNLVVVLPSPPPGTGPLGRTVMVTLPEDEAAMLMEDPFIQRLSSSVKMMMRV